MGLSAVTVFNEVQPSNAEEGIWVIEAGRLMLVSEEQPLKMLAALSANVTPSGRSMDFSRVAPEKAAFPSVFRVEGRTISSTGVLVTGLS